MSVKHVCFLQRWQESPWFLNCGWSLQGSPGMRLSSWFEDAWWDKHSTHGLEYFVHFILEITPNPHLHDYISPNLEVKVIIPVTGLVSGWLQWYDDVLWVRNWCVCVCVCGEWDHLSGNTHVFVVWSAVNSLLVNLMTHILAGNL